MIVLVEKLDAVFPNPRRHPPAKKLRFVCDGIPHTVRPDLVVAEVYVIEVDGEV